MNPARGVPKDRHICAPPLHLLARILLSDALTPYGGLLANVKRAPRWTGWVQITFKSEKKKKLWLDQKEEATARWGFCGDELADLAFCITKGMSTSGFFFWTHMVATLLIRKRLLFSGLEML